jgi:hypothetical protein
MARIQRWKQRLMIACMAVFATARCWPAKGAGAAVPPVRSLALAVSAGRRSAVVELSPRAPYLRVTPASLETAAPALAAFVAAAAAPAGAAGAASTCTACAGVTAPACCSTAATQCCEACGTAAGGGCFTTYNNSFAPCQTCGHGTCVSGNCSTDPRRCHP